MLDGSSEERPGLCRYLIPEYSHSFRQGGDKYEPVTNEGIWQAKKIESVKVGRQKNNTYNRSLFVTG